MQYLIVQKADGSLELRAKPATGDLKLEDGEALVSPDSAEGLAFLEGEVERQERAAKSEDALAKLAAGAAKQPVRKTAGAAAAGAGRQLPGDGGGSGVALLDRDAEDEAEDPMERFRSEFTGEARAGLGLEAYAKMTKKDARGGTKHFGEFLYRIKTDPGYKSERARMAEKMDPDLFRQPFQTRDIGEGTPPASTGGGVLVPPEYVQEVLDVLRAQSVGFKAGIQQRTIESNYALMPTWTADATAAWYSEAAAIAPSTPTLGQQTMTVRKLGAGIKISNEMVMDADPSIIQLSQYSMAQALALKLDLGFFEGSGTPPEITGIANTGGVTAGAALGANGATPTIDNLLDAQFNLLALNVDITKLAWVFHPRVLNTVRKIKDTTNNYILSSAAGVNSPGLYPALLDIPWYTTTQLSITRTVGSSTDCTNVYLADFSQDYAFFNGGLIMDLSTEAADATNSAFWSDQTWLRCKQRVGFLVRRPAAHVVQTGVRP